MSRTAGDQPTKRNRHSLRSMGFIALVIVAALSLAFAGYTALNPHSAMVTQQQFLTNTRSLYTIQTVTTFSTITGISTVTQTTTTGASYSQSCPYYGCSYSQPPYYTYPGYDIYGNFNPPCKSSGSNNTVQCTGYLGQNQNGCMVLIIPVSNPYILESLVFQYYTLHNLPSSLPSLGTLIKVTGHSGHKTSQSGAGCPGNYINVSTLSQ